MAQNAQGVKIQPEIRTLRGEYRRQTKTLGAKGNTKAPQVSFPGGRKTKPAIISNTLTQENEEKLIAILKRNNEAIGWSIDDLQGISPAYCMHKIKMEEEYKPVVQPQRRLNPAMSEVLKKETTKASSSRNDLPHFRLPM
jgi:hypothetical protein